MSDYQGDLRGFVKNFIFKKTLKSFPPQYEKDHQQLNGFIGEAYLKSTYLIKKAQTHPDIISIDMSLVVDSLIEALEKALEMEQKAFALKMHLEYHEEKRGEHKCLI